MKFTPTEEQKTIFHYIGTRNENILIQAYAGTGKCLGYNTPILMYDGTIKKVQDIKINDKIMGDDSTPRTVLNTNVGYGDLYKIVPIKGDEWVCNDVHVMTIHHEQKRSIIDIPLNDINYPKYKNGNFRYARLVRIGVDFNNYKNTNIDPYLVGLWLGDGNKDNGSPIITVNINESPIIDYLKNINYSNVIPKFNDYDKNGNLTISLTTPNFNGRKINNILRDEFRKCYDNNDNIIIPNEYLINSKENRLKLLAGLIDSDGNNGGNYYEIVTKYKSLSDNILFLCRSLGFAAYSTKKNGTIKSINFSGEYYRIIISGSLDNIPCLLKRKKCEARKQIKSVLRTGFKKEYISKGNYYGFTLDGNGRFILGDFTITHNTSTIVEAVKLIDPNKSIIFLAFNKHIQEELKEKLPEHVRCYTTYGLGTAAILRKYKNIKFDEFKIDKIINKKSKNWDLEDEFKDYEGLTNYLKDIKKAVNLCRLTLTLKADYIPYLMERHDLGLNKTKDIKRILKVLDEATTDRTSYDYTDMIFLPAIDNSIWMFPQDYVFIDEVQDTNRCQIKIIEKILKKDKLTGKTIGRLIAVGDKFQSIYGFNASDDKSFEWYEKYPNIRTLPLSYSFRCPKNVIKYANEIVPDIKALDDAIDGVVREGNVLEEAQSGDLVLCRTTAPLIKLFFELLLQHKKAFIRGGDIGLNLIEMIGGIKSIPALTAHWEDILKDFRNDLSKKGIMNPYEHSGYVALEDKVSVLLFLCGISKDIQNLIFKIKMIFDDERGDGIILSTVHKAKGSESDRVFIIMPELMPLPNTRGWQYGQEMNLKYVAITRARRELIIDNEWTDEDVESE